MMKLSCLLLSLLFTFNLFAKEKVYYVRKKDGKLYKVRTVKKKKSKVRRRSASENAVVAKKEDVAKKADSSSNFYLSIGMTSLSITDFNNNQNTTTRLEQESNYTGFEIAGGYQFMLDERISLTPGLFVRRTSLSKAVEGQEGVKASAYSVEGGAKADLGYDFYIEDTMILRPMGILGYSRGEVKGDYNLGLFDTETTQDFSRIHYGFGVQGIFANGLAPFAKLMFSNTSNGELVENTTINSSSAVVETEETQNTGGDSSERTIVFGLGYWF